MCPAEDSVSIPRSLINKVVTAAALFLVSTASAGLGVVSQRYTNPPVAPAPAPTLSAPQPVKSYVAKCPHCGGPLLITPSAIGQTGTVTGVVR